MKVPLKQYQFDALVSWTFNLGPGNLRSSTLLKKLNKRLYNQAPREIERWIKVNGRVLLGLQRRRSAEALLFQGKNWRNYQKYFWEVVCSLINESSLTFFEQITMRCSIIFIISFIITIISQNKLYIWSGIWFWYRVRKWFINHWFISWLYNILQNRSTDKVVQILTFPLSDWFLGFTGNNCLQIASKFLTHQKLKKVLNTKTTLDSNILVLFNEIEN